jgi:hypothetical protein
MNSIGQKVLKFLSPENEKSRMELRLLLAQNQANSEDINRTVKMMNGHMHECIEGWKKPRT